MELFSRRSWITRSAQKSNMNGILPCMQTCSTIFGGLFYTQQLTTWAFSSLYYRAPSQCIQSCLVLMIPLEIKFTNFSLSFKSLTSKLFSPLLVSLYRLASSLRQVFYQSFETADGSSLPNHLSPASLASLASPTLASSKLASSEKNWQCCSHKTHLKVR